MNFDAAELEHLSRDQFEALPFGAIELDAKNFVTGYNRYEATLARREVARTMGRHFFNEVAPCTNVEGFRGRLDALVEAGGGTETFDFIFKFPWGARRVRIRLVVHATGQRLVFVIPSESLAPKAPAQH